ncbi:MAG: FeS assembly SUF system protein [Gammaproteobacteria bacterium 39-13]|mgnify:CR=1 FL=1|nr:DUF59 domain-containing protein [Gammaproteobacteria bacterium]OJV88509.1 MAG: FeS assembly SUF system protein [Gammaproteobacteria bacterium 39-13]
MSNDAMLKDKVTTLLRTIYDPEIPVNLVDLGLIYRIQIEGKVVNIDMTLTNPACPVAAQFPDVVKSTIETLHEVDMVHINMVWDPPWTSERMSEEAKFTLGLSE